MARTPSRVQFEVACAARVRNPAATQHTPTKANSRNRRRLKVASTQGCGAIHALRIVTYKKRCANATQRYPGISSRVQQESRLMVDLHLVCNHRALVIAARFVVGDGRMALVQFAPPLSDG